MELIRAAKSEGNWGKKCDAVVREVGRSLAQLTGNWSFGATATYQAATLGYLGSALIHRCQ